ncbi:insulinase family protein [uncultured Dialister sp.]|jgi:Zn-dependent M16 (insulinase) family peptidase|uniref:insulinase family protein n=1 Tax=uncultured Dialister sp. TaxID=278064 RepID=UPI00262C9D8B|nr:insulinase family protein [uncultured Dialister sp.]
MKWKLGDMVHGFRVNAMSHIEEVNSDAYVMEHVKSGARLMYLDNDDDNKVFYIAFRTTPDNSKGVPHIMEHSTLCGSRKYPLKEPFVELAKGSLNTFLNAITWPDKTMYPIASRNDVDFHNLMDVYLDAVFYPNCLKNPQILMQEGWHYELENKEAPLTYNGVVYNEMKGALSSPEAIMEDRAMEKLFPDTTYGVESGGDPEVIPTLSFREFTEFHRRFYHPSNSYIYLYGDMDIDKTLEYLDGEYLSAFDRRNVDSMVKTQAPFGKRISVTAPYGIAENEDTEGKAIHALYNAFNDHMSTMDSLAFRILNYVLIDMDGAPLKQAVLDAGLGSDLSGSYGDSYKQPVWIVEVTGSEVDKQQAFADVVDSTLRSIALKGLDKDMLEAALNRTEFTARENDYQGRPKGLFYGVRAMDLWLYDRDPMEALRYIDDINTLRDNLKTNYFENLLLRYVIKNPHQVLITMKPEKGLTEKMNRETAEKLAAFKSSLSDEQLDEIMASTKALKERQASGETEEALETIPLLSRKDLKRTVEEEVLEKENVSGMDHFHFDVHTNGITYLNLYFPLSGLTEEDIPYAILLSTLLRSLSTTKHSYGELARLSNAYTGGMSFAVNGYGKVEDTNAYLPALTVRAKALTAKADKLLDLLGEVINHTLFTDTKRLKELILQEKSEWDMTAFSRGHSLVMTRLTSYFSRGGEFAEQSGLSYYYFLADLARKFDGEKEKLVAKLEEVSRKIFTRSGLFFETIGEEEEKKAVRSNLSLLVDDMEEGEKKEPRPFSFPPAEKNEAFRTSGKVQYVAKGGNFKSHGFAYTGALKVMETILRYEYLWKKVRVLGGAYGAFTQFLRDGTAILCSYRDPNLAETLKAYEDLPAYLENLTLSNREMTKYVIGTMAAAETQLTPSMKGERAMVHYLSGNTRESRMKIRDEVINCQVEDIRKLAPLVESVMKDPYICVMGSEDKIERDKALFDAVKSMPN